MDALLFFVTSITFAVVGVLFGWLKFDIYRWIGFKRRISNKNWGIIMFKSHGKSIFPIIVNFDNDTIKVNDAIWILEKGKIYREGEPQKSHIIDAKSIEFNQGCPIAYFSLDDMTTLSFSNEKLSSDVIRRPSQIRATLEKEIAAAEAEAVHMKEKEFQRIVMLLYIVIIFSLVAAVSAGWSAMTLETIKQMVASIPAR